ncbi:uncharacterized protein [Antedon mediterranea]|uniref:uncharacterized protein n=1 Tax=Antedon mediterranea TaxID=105859 RepID=UPI003AF6EBC4
MTDGLFSFGLFFYEEGDMSWDASLEDPAYATIGYNVDAENPTNFFTAGQYRPDEHNGNTGKRGQWVFRLDTNTEDTINPRKWCNDWYDQDKTESFSTRGLGTCPCTVQQIVRDSRYVYNPVMSLSQDGLGRGSDVDDALSNYEISSSVFSTVVTLLNDRTSYAVCFHSSTFNFFFSGTQCCYRINDLALLEGYNGIGASSVVFKYAYNFGFFGIFSQYINHIAYDIMPRYYCCSVSQDESLCEKYVERRPQSSCRGYTPPRWSWMFGDPHITTSDGYQYTFNGHGEFLCSDVDSGLFQLQCRMSTPISDENVEATIFSAFTGVHTMTSNTFVQFTLNEDGTDFDIVVNGSETVTTSSLEMGPYSTMSDPSFSISIQNVSNITRVSASWGNISFSVALQEKMLDVVLQFTEEYKGRTSGLFGIWNNNTSDDLCSPTMECLDTSTTLAESDIFETSNSWRLSEEDSMFVYPSGMSYEDFNDESFQPLFLDELKATADSQLLQEAEDRCGLNRQCLFDALATKNVDIGVNSKLTDETNLENEMVLENIPPVIDQIVDASSQYLVGQSQLNIMVNSTVTLTIEASDENDDTLTYGLEFNIPGSSIDSQSGVFTWTPTTTDVASLTFIVSDGTHATSAVMNIRICSCYNGGDCDFNYLLDGYDITDTNFVVVQCDCLLAWTGSDCSEDFDACAEEPCYPGVICRDNVAPEANATCADCPPGLVGNGFKCYDYDECAAGSDQDESALFCEHPELCTNTLGSYECACRSGYELLFNMKECRDIDECDLQTDSCSAQAQCENTDGGYNCTCNDGYLGDGNACDDINECQQNVYPCDAHADCNNIQGSFFCVCIDGYMGTGETCTDVDECRQGTYECDPNADCINTEGSYRCTCSQGFEGNSTYCEDIDECIARPLDCHPMSDCTNTIGSYMCTCPDGYRGDGSTCFDIDECAESDGICLEFEECFNTDGSYGCRCITGYDRATEGADCTDVDECVPVNGRTPCSSNGICNNIIGSYSCDCVQGYFGDGLDCLDIDECSNEVDECDQVCTNTVGNYTCGCNDGFELGSDERSCIPLENSTCPDDTNPCDASATCIINKDGNQQCYCDKGYTLVNMGCENVNECDLNQDDCDTTNGNCIDTEGSYGCACADGYELLQDLRTCTDIDECTESNTCVATAQCSNSDGSFTCECLAGYTGSSCSNIDECTSDSSDCHENANCEDTEGSYRCTCQDGYTGNGQTCIDVNECLSSEVCHTFATCSNTDGSFTCTCISGYSGDGIDSCIDNNECNDSPCDANADCTNLPGTYTCACMTGHRGDGFVSCINIDECTEQPNICPEQATCTDTDGFYECECNDGFVTDGSDCTDVDECQLNTDNCDVNSMCNNTIGSYTCRCNRGYVSEANARAGTCMDYDECFYNIDDCSAFGICTNNIGSYSCECKPGFDGDGEICTDTDECDQVTNPCNLDNNERCVNTQGSFNCVCQTSYFNRSGECLLVVAKTLNAKFLYIKGLLTTMFANTLDLDQVSIELANDIDTLFSQSNLAENYFGAVTENINIDNSTDGVEVEFTLSFDDQYNVTDAMVLGAFFNGLTGNTMDILEPNSQIIRDNTDVVETVVNPCDEGTDDCTERLFEECVFVSNEQFTCQTCSSGYMLSDDESTCVDIDECDQNPCENNELCTNVAGGFSCSCTDGYFSSSSGCVVAVSFRGELRVVEINQVLVAWDPELEDPSSDLFMEYAELMCSIISNAYNSLSSAFYGCTVIGFKEGSIIAVYQVQFFTNSTMNGEELLELLLNETDNNNILSDENNNITLDVTHDVVGEDLPIVCEEGYCYNSGSCSINSLLEKECSCVNNFSGDRCEECPSNYCENGGNCSTSSGVASCSCPLYFSGSQCQTISCPDDYCQNGGSCLITIQNPVPSCNCPLHFSGSLCEIVSCPGDYCQNGGTCSITVENPVPTCSCVSDYSGDQCQTSSDDSLVLILIIISAIAGLTLFVILIFCCMLFVANRRRERHQQAVKHFTGQHDRGMVARNADYYEGLFGYSRQPFFHETDSVSSHGDDSRLSHLAQVLRNAPHLNNKMRESSLSGSEFSRPYVATGMEARDLDLEEMERNRGSRITTIHNFSARDPQRQSTSRNFYF